MHLQIRVVGLSNSRKMLLEEEGIDLKTWKKKLEASSAANLQKFIDEIIARNKEAEDLPFNDLMGKDAIYQQVDKLKKDRNKKIEEVLLEILPEAFAVVKETARRFKENKEIILLIAYRLNCTSCGCNEMEL